MGEWEGRGGDFFWEDAKERMEAETWRWLGGCEQGGRGQRLRRLSADQQLVRFTLVNTNCSTLIKVSRISPKAPLPHHPSHPTPYTQKNTNKHNMSLYLAPLRLAIVSLLISALLSFPVKTHWERKKQENSNFFLFPSTLNEHFLLEGRSSPLVL